MSQNVGRAARTQVVDKGVRWTLVGVTALESAMWVLASNRPGAPPTIVVLLVSACVVPAVWALLATSGRPIRKGLIWATLFLTFAGGSSLLSSMPDVTALVVVHTLWALAIVFGSLVLLVMRPLLHRAQRLDQVGAKRQREIDYERQLERERDRLSAPTGAGITTGFEPRRLRATAYQRPAMMYGSPGLGLSGAGFGASARAKGVLGETNFAKALSQRGMLERFATFWSVHMPSETVGPSSFFQSDIDSVVVTGQSIWLIDLKFYRQGNVTWRDENGALFCIDNPTGFDVGEPRHMSRNMSIALDRVSQKMRALDVRHRVIARVTMMPTDDGIGIISATWPGGIRAESLLDTMTMLQAEPAFDPGAPGSEHIVRVFRWLVKDESGSAARPGRVR